MNISRIFILRPIATSLLMAALLLSGLLAYRYLPIAALPQIDYPTMQVQTFYPGASPDVMAAVVTAPLERQFGTMSGLVQMSSQSSAGASVITLQFDLSVPLDVAEQEVQAAINAADSLLPRDLPNPPVYSKVNPADPPIMTLAVVSDAMPLTRLEDLVDTRLAQKISQLPPGPADPGFHRAHIQREDVRDLVVAELVDETADGDGINGLRIREADLSKHLTNGDEEVKQEDRLDMEDELKLLENAKNYKPIEYGTKKDFQLMQAINHLKGKPVKLSKAKVDDKKADDKKAENKDAAPANQQEKNADDK